MKEWPLLQNAAAKGIRLIPDPILVIVHAQRPEVSSEKTQHMRHPIRDHMRLAGKADKYNISVVDTSVALLPCGCTNTNATAEPLEQHH